MSDNLVTIEATARTLTGKGANRKLRAKGKIPAVLYNHGKAETLELDPKLLPKAWTGGKKFNLSMNGSLSLVKIQELQIDPVKRLALHVDLVPTA